MDVDDFQALLDGARRGEDRAFSAMWRTFNPPLIRYLRVIGSAADADDLASITWFEAVRSLDRFSGGEDQFRAWLFTIARMRLLDQRRRESRRIRTVASDDVADPADIDVDPQVLSAAAASTEAALAAISRLAPDQAEIVALRVIAGLEVATVAEITGHKPGTVRVIAHRAVKRLASMIELDETGGLAAEPSGDQRAPIPPDGPTASNDGRGRHDLEGIGNGGANDDA